jgi:hypothetical protein
MELPFAPSENMGTEKDLSTQLKRLQPVAIENLHTSDMILLCTQSTFDGTL